MDAKVEMVEGPWELPIGWCWASLESVAERITDGTHQPPKFVSEGVPFIVIGNLKGGKIDWPSVRKWVSAETFKAECRRIRPQCGDVLYTAVGSYGAAVTVPPERDFMFQRHIAIVRPTGALLNHRFLCHALNSPQLRRQADQVARGVAQKTVTLGSIRNFRIPLPPLPEQRRIVERIDILFAEIAEGEAALDDARQGLETFRRALLKAAVTGELTRNWRENNKPAETGHDLIARGLAAPEGKGGLGRRGKREATRQKLETSDLSDLPEGWVWARLGEMLSAGPTNGYSPKASRDGSGTLSLKLTATTAGHIDLSDRAVKTLSEHIELDSDLYLSSGDLLFQRGNTIEYVGISAIFEGPAKTFIYPDLMIRVRTSDAKLTEWVWRVANSPLGRRFMMDNATGTAGTMPKISGATIGSFPVPVPPPAEAIEILRRVSEALSALSDTTAMLEAEAADAARLRQSILKAAFEGKLTEQDPDDEPATALLAGIRTLNPSIARTRRQRQK